MEKNYDDNNKKLHTHIYLYIRINEFIMNIIKINESLLSSNFTYFFNFSQYFINKFFNIKNNIFV
jgi:hypothetical protein